MQNKHHILELSAWWLQQLCYVMSCRGQDCYA